MSDPQERERGEFSKDDSGERLFARKVSIFLCFSGAIWSISQNTYLYITDTGMGCAHKHQAIINTLRYMPV